MADGWIAVSRGLTDTRHELHPQATGEPACRAWAWVDLIGYAKWKPEGGLQRGELVAGESFLAARWNWTKSRVHRFLVDLEASGRIERSESRGPRQPNRIKICNYDTYQDLRIANDTRNESPTSPKKNKNNNLTTNTAVMAVFEYWRKRRADVIGKEGGPKMKPTGIRLSKVNARLGEGYTIEDLKRAVDGCLAKKYNVENGYMDLELICRDQQHVEQYLAKAKNGGSTDTTYHDPSRGRL